MVISFDFEKVVFHFGIFLALILIALCLFYTYSFAYWRNRGVPHVSPSFPFGNMGDAFLLRKQMGLVLADIYVRLNGHKFGGFYQMHQPSLMLRDLDHVKDFLVKGFGNFHDRGVYFNEEDDPLSGHLFMIGGQKWKDMRAKLTPTFTSGKMRTMFQTVQDCAEVLRTSLHSRTGTTDVIEVNDLMARYTTDVIASCAFGIQCNCLVNPEAEFRLNGRNFFARDFFSNIGFAACFLVPSVAKMFNWGNTPKHIAEFFMRVVRETITYREENEVRRDDFMQLMIQIRDRDALSGSTKSLTVNEIAAQAFAFYLAGFETSGTTLTFCLYELASNPHVQTRVREEMRAVLSQHGGKLNYDAMQEMVYLDMVLAETMRLHPPLPQLNRVCTERYRVPDSNLVVEPGTLVVVPVYAIHHDPEHYPEPERFDPERFSPKVKAGRNPFSYLSFGEGPRNCIGKRFAMVQMKTALVSMMTGFEFRVCEQTDVPPAIDVQTFVMVPKGGVSLQVLRL